MKSEEVPTMTVLAKNYHKILNVIASCEDGTQIYTARNWFMSLPRVSGVDDAIISGLNGAVTCRYYQMVMEFNTLKALSRKETVEEYTEGRQKFYVSQIRRLYERANT